MKPISSRVHGAVDYASVVALLALPSFGMESPPVRAVLRASALGTLAYSVLTRYELGVIKLIPMQVHLALDASSGAALCAAALLISQAEPGERAALVGIGLFELAAASLTQPESSAT